MRSRSESCMAETTMRPRPTWRSTNSPPVFGKAVAPGRRSSWMPDQAAVGRSGSPGTVFVEIIQPSLSSARSLSSASNLRGPPLVAGRYGSRNEPLSRSSESGPLTMSCPPQWSQSTSAFSCSAGKGSRIDFVPQDVGDARPGERVVGQRRELVGAQFDDAVVERFFGVVFIGFAVERRPHRVDRS